MKRNYTSRLIEEMNQLLDKGRKLNETMQWSPEQYDTEANEPGFDAGPELAYGYEDEEDGGTNMEQPALQGDPEVTNMINQIRQIALQGIAKLANNPTSPQYDALKKVWQIIDKTVEVKDTKQGV